VCRIEDAAASGEGSPGTRDAALDGVLPFACDLPLRFELVEELGGARGDYAVVLAAVAALEDAVSQRAAVAEQTVFYPAVAVGDDDCLREG
jgi:hypothetical protein